MTLPFPPLLEPSELAAIREVGLQGMQTEIQIWRSSVVPENPSAMGYDPTTDYGDDEVTDPVQVNEPEGGIGDLVATTWGWFFSQLQTNVVDASGQLTTLDIHICRIPVGIDVRPADFIIRVDNASRYSVVDTNNDDTWPEEQKVTLRRRE